MANTFPSADIVTQIQNIETSIINLLRTLDALNPPATNNAASAVQALSAINAMFVSVITNGPT